MPFWIPLAIGAAGTALGELMRDRRGSNMEGVQFPHFDYGAQRRNLYGQLGEQSNRAARSAQMASGSGGVYDAGRNYSQGRGIASDAMRAYAQGDAAITGQENASKQAEAQFNMNKAQYMDQYRQQQPGFLDSLAGGVQLASSIYPMMNPSAFTQQMGGQQMGGQQLQFPRFNTSYGQSPYMGMRYPQQQPYDYSQGSQYSQWWRPR